MNLNIGRDMADPLAGFARETVTPLEVQITAFLRDRIADGSLSPGTRLPSTSELARQWAVTVPHIQAALRPLVREGLVVRRQRLGTVVCERPPAITRVGLYRREISGLDGHERSAVRIEAILIDKLRRQGVATVGFHETRPDAQRWELLPDLRSAIRTRTIDALIACETDMIVNHHLARMPIPIAANNAPGEHGAGGYDFRQFARAGAACLAARGCRSAGLVSVLPPLKGRDDREAHAMYRLIDLFRAAAAEQGLATAERWILAPGVEPVVEPEAERFGYDRIRGLWSAPDRPDGLLVFTDRAARGVIMGLLAVLDDGDRPPALVLHRNRELGLFCPLPADFLETSLERTADALWEHILDQRRGGTRRAEPLPFAVVAG